MLASYDETALCCTAFRSVAFVVLYVIIDIINVPHFWDVENVRASNYVSVLTNAKIVHQNAKTEVARDVITDVDIARAHRPTTWPNLTE